MRYILKQQFYRFIMIAIVVFYDYLQVRGMPFRLDWRFALAVNALGLLGFIVITAKIRIASAHVKHHRQQGGR